MDIRVKCERPKYASGEYQFNKFEDLFHWLGRIKGLSQGAISAILYGLAKDGFYSSATARDAIHIKCDFNDYFLASELGYRLGLLKTRRMGEHITKDRSVALQFAKEWDNLTLRRSSN